MRRTSTDETIVEQRLGQTRLRLRCLFRLISKMATSAVSTTDRFYFTKEQLENTPSRKNGVDPEKEQSYRQQAATLIQDMGQRLSVYPCLKSLFYFRRMTHFLSCQTLRNYYAKNFTSPVIGMRP